jgi:putative membrane protein
MGYASIQNMPTFVLFFAIAAILVAIYLFIYTWATAHNEFELIRRNNIAAALSLGLSLMGFALPLSSAVVNSATAVDLGVWGVVGLSVQIIVYWLVRMVLPNLSERIAGGEVAAALFLGAASLAAGVITAAAMTF